ncbi:VOC family protein [Brevibacterium sp. FAM 24630]|uniref:VOC family protein n=2 Tax=unclassified Brevibacterium TaxID=2614124 RepID=UPI003C7B2CB2
MKGAEMESTFRGVFLTCADAEATAAFYRDIAGQPLTTAGSDEYTYFLVETEGVQIAFHSAEAFADYAFPPVAESNLTHLYFRIPDQAGFLERIRHAGVPIVAVDDVVVTVEDPDGRKVMFGTA